MDENGRRRRYRTKVPEVKNGVVEFNQSTIEAARVGTSSKRECPVPKPGGMIGEWLGFHKSVDAADIKRRPDR